MMMTMLEIGRFSDSVAMDMDSSETFELFSGGAMAGLSSVSGERERERERILSNGTRTGLGCEAALWGPPSHTNAPQIW